MLTLDRPQDAKLKERDVTRGVRVRVRPNGPMVDLPLGKTTIGSSPRCNIRIQQPGVQPLHCLILLDADGLSVRRWAGETVLNGQRLEESSIGPGDCLQVGPVELEIVRPQSAITPTPLTGTLPAIPNAAPATVPAIAQAPMADAPAPENLLKPQQADSSQHKAGRDLARSRTRQMLAALRNRREADHEVRARVLDLERQLERAGTDRMDVANQLENVQSELAAAHRNIADQQALSAQNQEFAAQNDQLNREVSSLTQRIEQLANEQSSSAAAYRAMADEKEALANDSRRLADENGQLREQLQHHTNRLAELSAERDEARGKCDSLLSKLHLLTEREAATAGNAARLENELAQLQQQTAELTNRVSNTCGERDDAWRQCESLRSEVHSLNEREAVLAQNVGRLEHENAQLQGRETELSNQVSGVISERDEAWRQGETLRAEVHDLKEREAELSQNNNRLEHETAQRQTHETELLSQIGALRGEREELQHQNEQLRSEVKDLGQERAALADEQAVVNRERESLRQQLQAATEEAAASVGERDQLVAECERLRHESDRLPHLEQKLRDAVADRENTSSELYRALLQLAEMQERDDHNIALVAAHTALDAELAKSLQDIAALQSQIDRLSAERLAADEMRQALDQQTAGLIEAHQQLAYDKAALSTELAELREKLEAARRQDAESAARVATLEALRQRLEETERSQSELTETVARLQSELTSKEQAGANAAAAIADHERQIAEYSQRNAESDKSVKLLDKKLAEANDSISKYEQTCDQWKREREEAQRQHAQLSQRIADLESQLTEANSAKAEETVARLQGELASKEQAETLAASVIAGHERQLAEYSQLLADSGAAVRMLENKLAEAGNIDDQFEQARDEWQRECEDATSRQLQLTQRIEVLESQLIEARAAAIEAAQIAADAKSSAENAYNNQIRDDKVAVPAELPGESTWTTTSSESQTPIAAESPAEAALQSLESKLGCGQSSDDPAENAASDWSCESSHTTPSSELADEQTEVCEPTVLPNEPRTGEAVQLPSYVPTESFIDRYSHMFAESEAASGPQSAPVVTASRENLNSLRNPANGRVERSSGHSLSARADDEESIEDYMAKLLQRVRGESPAVGSTTSASPVKPTERALPIPASAGYSSTPLTAPPSMVNDLSSPMGFDPLKRRSSMPAPQTDLEALRALANESARRAISRHSLRKHRRIAVTKVIVSTLAGMTSLWLMLDSENSWSLQFITACVAMLVAAYWACEAFRALLETIRVAKKDEIDVEIEELTAELRNPLPIDVESSRPWASQESKTLEQDAPAERILVE